MSARTARIAAAAGCVFAYLVMAAYVLVAVNLPPEVRPAGYGGAELLAPGLCALLGMLIVFRRPRLLVAWLLLAFGACSALRWLMGSLAGLVELAGDPPWALQAVTTGGVVSRTAGYLLWLLIPLLYPDVSLRRSRWRWVCLALAVWCLGQIVVLTLAPVPSGGMGPPPWAVLEPGPALAVVLDVMRQVNVVLPWLSLVPLLIRFRYSGPDVRRQIGWLLLAMAIGAVPTYESGHLWPTVLSEAAVPVAIAVAVLRYRLYAIDTLVSRAVLGAALLGFVAVAYLPASALTGVVLSGRGEVVAAVAGILAGLAFRPVHATLQRGLDRMLYGRSGDPRTHARALQRQIQRAGPAEALAAAVQAVMNGLAVTGATVTAGRQVACGELGPSPREIPLVWHGEQVGTLLIGAPGRRRFPPAYERRMLAVLVPIVADVAHAVRLAEDLRHHRERAAVARDEERRRLHRDLHDGLGTALTAMAMSLDAARRSLDDSPEHAYRLLTDLRLSMNSVTAEIRALVYDLHPPGLKELRLEAAVRSLAAEAGPPADVRATGDLTALPPAIETAAYRIVQEAVTNARRHAGASRITVELSGDAERVRVRIADDGTGLPERPVLGAGLTSMRERAAELGGTCLIAPGEQGGTVVEAVIPLPPGRLTPPDDRTAAPDVRRAPPPIRDISSPELLTSE
ncbi:signal transduction histidine kinase [Thermocatellispora tengchongensis]|uniref:histidine kinase n=1 Tax=Thermocatellispora tengchongensis TaxID=1073253 RepID=A0A840P9A6_9ACTN|nr:sensor histidine kinase [Thermocatellispora tengchongensis]MBB5133787.1 signal transduction histidine kinase [Thermocatellispora tengchongensis]